MIETETPHSAFSAEAELEWKARADFAGVQKSSCSKKETVLLGFILLSSQQKTLFLPLSETMRNQVYQNIAADHSKGLKKFAVLIDPDEVDAKALNQFSR